jgi:DNA polymerase-1
VSKLVFDCEANGLLDTVDKIHCVCSTFVDSDKSFSIHSDNLTREGLLNVFKKADGVIGHYIINYDIPLLKMFYGIDLIDLYGIDNIVDTAVLSQLLNPDRELPKGCPNVVFNKLLKKNKKIGPHSLEAWGYRVGHKKIEIFDWSTFDEDMLKRCEVDVEINKKVYFELMKEAGIES